MTLPTKTEARNSCFRAKINPGYLIRIIRAVLVGGTLIRLGVRALSFMIQCQLKLKLTARQERQLNHWLRHLQGVWNWSIRKIEQDAELRAAKQAAHAVFDPLWAIPASQRASKRKAAYAWLAELLGMSRKRCHIGKFDVETCRRATAICKERGNEFLLTVKKERKVA